jgi:hypothetical protein
MFDPATIASPRLRRLYDYWDAKRAGRPMPARPDIDPLEIPWALGDIALIDVLPDGEFRWRLDGTRLVEFFGSDLTGLRLAEHPSGVHIPMMRRTLETPVAAREPFHQFRPYSKDTLRWNYESLLLPLSGDGTRVDMLLQMLDIKRPDAARAGG